MSRAATRSALFRQHLGTPEGCLRFSSAYVSRRRRDMRHPLPFFSEHTSVVEEFALVQHKNILLCAHLF